MTSATFAVVLAAALAACDPRSSAPEPAPPPELTIEPGPRPPGLVDDAGLTVECVDAAAHVADVLIAATTDATQQAALAQDRTKLIRRTAETCARDGWSEPERQCFLSAKTSARLEACGRALSKP